MPLLILDLQGEYCTSPHFIPQNGICKQNMMVRLGGRILLFEFNVVDGEAQGSALPLPCCQLTELAVSPHSDPA
jgi:hypothetical protein